MPLHLSLWKGDANLFHDDEGWAMTSELFRWFAGGLLAHAPALLAFCAPTVNSYRRLGAPGAPTSLVLSRAKPEAACRVPARMVEPHTRRLKFRLCDATVNPYLAFAAVLMAGLDGVVRKLDPPVEDARAALFLPRSLDEALEALEADHGFLEEAGVFAPELIAAWISQRRQSQVDALRALPHPMERLVQVDHGF
jgi:glutamine synthetase